jgi:cytochrome c-type protein NapC
MSKESPGFVRRSWRVLSRPSARYSILALGFVGFFAGIIFWGGFNTAMEATNTLPFCISCHEMRDNVYKEYKDTIHFSNRVGVRAVCSDCHVPHAWGPKMVRKARASLEVWGKLTGAIDTPEKFEAKRMELATIEWARMKANNSRECRNCHDFDAMDKAAQKPSAYARHMKAKADGQACIDCHKGIAHHLPKEYKDPDEE